jgi:DNA topoisomerase-3
MRDAAVSVPATKRAKKQAEKVASKGFSAGAEVVPERQARLEQALRAWRLAEAKRRNMPAFRIFGDRTLRNIASTCPRSDSDFLAVPGIGMGTVEKYGAQIYHLIAGVD